MRATLRTILALAALGATAAAPPSDPASGTPSGPIVVQAPASAAAKSAFDPHAIAKARFGNDAPWYEARIPFFESADPKIDAVYYYRWALFRAHQRDLGAQGYITTEFADDVDWQREPFASLNDASGFHIAEGRWLNDRRFTDDYVNFMYEGGNDRHFTDYMADSVWGRYLVDGERDAVLAHVPVMRHVYRLWDEKFDFTKGLYFVEPLLDATEYTVSSIDASGGKDGFRGGDAFRPSVNAYMFANARALSRMAALAGDAGNAADYAARAETLRRHVLDDLWNPKLEHFTDRYQVTTEHAKYWDPIRNRELVGYLPWMFDLVPDDAKYAKAWAHLTDAESLAGKAGMRTVEKNYEYYMRQYRYLGTAPECQWNGPIWPYQTTQVLEAMANVLDHYGQQGGLTRSDWMRELRQYTALHYQGDKLDIEEDYDPETGKPIVGLARSHHYFHSGYNDLILTGLVGIRPRADDILEVNPLLPAAGDAQSLAWFHVEKVPYHGHQIAVTWDADGSHYGKGKGLAIAVDGSEVARRADLGKLTVPLARKPNADIDRTDIDLAVQLVRGQFPKPDASSGTDPEKLHDAVDGRTWFYPELPNGWDSAVSDDAQWFALDFGRTVNLARADLAFFADGATFAAPRKLTIEVWSKRRWRKVAAPEAAPLANGITQVRWPAIDTERLRVKMEPEPGHAIRLAELKAFAQ
jgi:hypothetical protein